MSSVVGIDFGFQNSVIAAAGRGGVDVILNGNSNRLNPTMVGFDECRKMGEHATSGVTSNYKNTVKGMKRLVGLSFTDPRAKKEMKDLPLQFCPISRASGGPDSIGVQVQMSGETKLIPIEAIAGMMIKHMGYIAAEKAKTSTTDGSIQTLDQLFPQDWVVAVPNYYTDAQRRALLIGCEICGVKNVQRLMHENTATALAYGIFKDMKKVFANKEQPTHVMFIDMGASAYSVSIAAFEPGKFTVKSSFCDPDLGGRDFDYLIAEWIATQFEAKFKNKLSGKPMERPKSRLKLLTAAEKAKKTLSPQGVKEARINLEMLMDDLDFGIGLKADEYEAMCAPLLDRLHPPIKSALEEAKLTSAQLDSVEIVGGSTRIGCVKRRLVQILGMQLSTTMNADEAVARGAALQSAILSPRFKVLPYEIQEAQPYPIQINWAENGAVAAAATASPSGDDEAPPADSVIMFDRGLSFPIVRRVTLKRSGDFEVRAVYDPTSQQFGLAATDPTEISKFSIKVPAGPERKVRVNVKEDIHGIIHLSSAQMVEEIEEEDSTAPASEGGEAGGDAASAPTAAPEEEKKKKIKKTNLEFSVTRPMDWTMVEINRANEDEVSMANTDRLVKETADMRNELESYIYDMRDKVTSDSHLGPYGTDAEKEAFTAKNTAMENWLYEEGFDATKTVYAEKLAELRTLGGPMERRLAESQGRSGAVNSLQQQLQLYQNWVNESQSDDRYQHITDEERAKVRDVTDQASAWMYDLLDKQGGLAPNQDPVLKVADLLAKTREVMSACKPIREKPVPSTKPGPPKVEAEGKKPEEAAKEGMDVEKQNGEAKAGEEAAGGAKAEGAAEPMDTD